jgi:uncharacterized protein
MSPGSNFIPPEGKAAMGLALLKEAILDHLDDHPDGLRNGVLAKDLGLESSHDGRQQDYLTYSLLGILLMEHQVEKVRRSGKAYYVRVQRV